MSFFGRKTKEGLILVKLDPHVHFDPDATLSILILDRSGSMKIYGTAPQNAVNQHLEHLRRDKGTEHYCVVVSFCDEARVEVPLGHVMNEKMKMANYYPEGHTLLYETVNMVMTGFLDSYERIVPKMKRTLRVVVGVFSDGADNRSDRNYPAALVATATRVRSLGWELMTFGIGIDGAKLARKMGFPDDEAHALTVAATRHGVHHSMNSFSQTTTTRATRSSS